MNISDKQQFALICILLAGIWCASFAFECTPERGYDGCACYRMRNNTKEYVNLLPLKTKSSSPRFTVLDKDRFYISYSPCGVFSEFVGENQTGYIPCIKASVARWTNLSTHRCESLGDDDHAKFESTVIGGNIKSNLTLTFRSEASGHHTAKISLVCNDNLPENETFLEYINTTNVPTDTYFLALTSKCCCPGKCGSPPELPPTPSPTVSNATTGRTGKPPVSSSGPLGALEMGVVALVAGSVLSASFGV